MKYTRNNLKKLETLYKDIDYTIRYEKGNFTSGYCMVESRNIIVINKFYDTEGRINVLMEILGNVSVDENKLTEESQKFYSKILKSARNSQAPDAIDEEE